MALNLSVFILLFVSVLPLVAAETLVLPATVQRAEASHAQSVSEVTAKALRDIDNSKQRLLKVLNRELKTAERKEDQALALKLRERIAVLEEKPAPANLFGDAFASIAEQEQPGISILGDDLHLYNWLSGEPREQRALSQEGAVCFVPTGNNHFPLLEQYILGSKKGQIRKVSFYVYLTEKESALIFQACINKSWNNRVGLDGRAAYAGAYGWPRKHNIVDVATKQWVKIEIDFIDDLGAVEGDTLSHLAFSGQDESLHYDNVCLIEGQE